ncbi:MAG: DUF4931 domain-containing protein [Schwartzia sp.]|nr:DUF4931 domain-containing protein [Schwartzia sp. (in: firmicutes)]
MKINLICFDMNIGKGKPENIVHKENDCPFCHPEGLTDIYATGDGGIILLKNKYDVLADADQLVLVETDRCGVDMPDYTKEHMRRLIRFGIGHWREMETSGKYSAVIFFKNHGHLSGGTMRHAHMQLVGFRGGIDRSLFPDTEDFEGLPIVEKDGVLLNAATHPRLGFGEFNLVASQNEDAIDLLADLMQKTVAYICDRFHKSQDSYNIFFYHAGERIAAKIMPRFPTSPLMIGYDLRILPSNLPEMVKDFQANYL